MRIGFDAYFAFHFKTGVAHYSRNLINSIAGHYPGAELFLFTDQRTTLYEPSLANIHVVETGTPAGYHEWLEQPALMESIQSVKPGIFHGLDHALPPVTGIPLVVTVHDLFFETHPELYAADDVSYYRHQTPIACERADRVISISEFTSNELVKRYGVPPDKISLCYQTCNQLFFEKVTEERKAELRQTFDLPPAFWLYVGAISERKNLLGICEAMHLNRHKSSLPLVVIGEGGNYLQQVQSFLVKNNLAQQVRFLSYTEAAKRSLRFQQAKDVPAFYQMAMALLYPSQLEGFGIPLIEAFASGLPVITSRTTSLPEVGGDAACYVDPSSAESIASALLKLEHDPQLRHTMIQRGKEILPTFTAGKTAAVVWNLYQQLI